MQQVPIDHIPMTHTDILNTSVGELVLENRDQMVRIWTPEEYEAQLALADTIEEDIIKLLEARGCTYVLALAVLLKMAMSARMLIEEADEDEDELERSFEA